MSRTIREHEHGDYRISTDPSLVDIDVVHHFLSNDAYWALGRTRQTVDASIAHSALVAGAYTDHGELVAFARMVSDLATFAWLCDVFVLDGHRGRGLGRAVVAMLVEHPTMASLPRQLLVTNDAHALYARFGFEDLAEPEKWMSRSPRRG